MQMKLFAQIYKQMDYSISIVLDERRAKQSGLFPVKLRVYHITQKKAKLYSTKFDLSKKDFESIVVTTKPRNEHKELRAEIQAIETRANEVSKKLIPFSFPQFEKKFLQKAGDNTNLIYHYHQIISRFKANKSFGTASTYELSLKSFITFITEKKGKEPARISFFDITPEWLQKYEDYMIGELERSRTTVSMYVRTLRAVFNSAIADKDIDNEIYPFGGKKYSPPNTRKVKKSLPKADLGKLYKAKPMTPEQQKAKDFWFFSYYCNGMNIKDIALIRYKDLNEESIRFIRAKTIKTSKSNLQEVIVYLNDFTKKVLKKYSNPQTSNKDFVFPIISDNDKPEIQHKKVKNFTKFINQNLKKLAINNNITGDISTYWARHSYSTSVINNGGTIEFLMEALSHNNPKTTKNYIGGFEDETKREIAKKLMAF